MPRRAIYISDAFRRYLSKLDYTRRKVEELLIRKRVVMKDVEQVYKGLFLDAVAAFEEFFENLFIGLSTKKIKPGSSRVSLKVFFRNEPIARPIITGGNYYDWFPYYRTKKKAKQFFKNGYPFTCLTNIEIDLVEKIIVARNAIAHKSYFAKKNFEDRVIGLTSLLPKEKRVAAYLRGRYSLSSPTTRYEDLVMTMASIAEKICTY
ncbi:MAG: hypothetical protein C0412_20105 [Flavobacterium sp.]|nr:hypothetical protein [Flavobacterium sp.]